MHVPFRDLVQTIQEYSNCSREVWIARIESRDVGKSRWGNNTPKDVFYVEEIIEFYPNAKILLCVRDPRDFCLSYKHRWEVTTEGHKNRLKSLYHPVITSLLWKSTVQRLSTLKSIVPSENLCVIHYESLVLMLIKLKLYQLCLMEMYSVTLNEVSLYWVEILSSCHASLKKKVYSNS